MKPFSRFLSDDAGLETVEYAILAGLIVGASVTLIIAVGVWVKDTYASFQAEIQ